MKWNDEGTSVIVLAQTEVDKSNKSYYGETNMYILSANGGFDSRIQLGSYILMLQLYEYMLTYKSDKEGPIHDVSWSPNSKEFGVVYGWMPAKTTIFNQRAVATHSFNLSPRNTIIFSPHGRFVIVAGFGNLQGQMDIYDLEKNYEKVCTIEGSNTSTCEWSPDGKHILTAVTSPRLRVDNGIRIWHVGGGLLYNEDMTELYHVVWRPQSTLQHPLGNPLHPVPAPHASALDFLGKVKTPSKPAGAYRPPGARGTSTPLAYKREDEGGNAFMNNGISSTSSNIGVNGFGKPRRREVPGAETVDSLPPGAAPGGGVSLQSAADGDENLSKAALKNKKKREAKKAKDAEAKAAGLTAPATNGDAATTPNRSPERRDRPRSHSKSNFDSPGPQTRQRNGSNSRARGMSQLQTQSMTPPPPSRQAAAAPIDNPTPPASAAPDLTVTSPNGGSPEEKKIRSLLKKLRAIDDLKMRQAGGEKLEGTQVLKIGTEEGVRKDLGALGYTE